MANRSSVNVNESGAFTFTDKSTGSKPWVRPATEAEISAHQLKIQEAAKKAAEEAERAKPIAFSAPIMYHDRKGVFLWKEGANAYKLALSTTDTYSGQTVVAIRSEFKVLTD